MMLLCGLKGARGLMLLWGLHGVEGGLGVSHADSAATCRSTSAGSIPSNVRSFPFRAFVE
jgi:hypothetical protein